MRAEELAIDLPERLQVRQIFLDVDDIPGQTNQMFGAGAGLGQDGGDIAQDLTELRNETAGKSP